LKTFPEKWKLLFRNVGLLKILIIFENFFREIEVLSRITKLFKYIFNGIDAFLKWCEYFQKI
jgi:hypothetical protein